MPFALEKLPAEERLRRSRAFLETMKQRRSCRFFSRASVERELIENAIRTAATAPSGANQQPWTFVVVEDMATKVAIRAAAEEVERAFYDTVAKAWRDALAPLGTDAVKEHITDAPYLIVVFARTYGIVRDDAGEEVPRKHYYVRESVGIACGLLLASLTAAGLATLPHTPSPMSFLATLLGRPANERAALLVPVGHPADHATVPKHALEKRPIGDVLVWR
ncbi:MAG: nitroreductase family protein [Labilithrix sp.]